MSLFEEDDTAEIVKKRTQREEDAYLKKIVKDAVTECLDNGKIEPEIQDALTPTDKTTSRIVEKIEELSKEVDELGKDVLKNSKRILELNTSSNLREKRIYQSESDITHLEQSEQQYQNGDKAQHEKESVKWIKRYDTLLRLVPVITTLILAILIIIKY